LRPDVKLDTIAAIATPPGTGGVGIIKISGPESLHIASRLFRSGPVPDLTQSVNDDVRTFPFRPWHLHYGYILDYRNGQAFDEVLLAVMPAPHSYTREDVVEIQAHAGPLVLRRILDLVLDCRGIRLAEPGEFTRRAFLNGRIDLSKAEAVMDLITANSDAGVEIAMAHISGRFSDSVKKLIETLYNHRIRIEAEIDFPDSTDEEFDYHRVASDLNEFVLKPINRLIAHHQSANFFRDGLSVVIAGGPNVGKSSLMNCLLHKNRAIVSDIPGTTRDFIEASMVSRGIPIVLTDTAGFRTNADSIETLGIENANQVISSADIILFVVDASKAIDADELLLFDLLEKMRKKRIVIINKWDTPEADRIFNHHRLLAEPFLVNTSCVENTGIEALQNMIADMVTSESSVTQDRIVPNLRQCIALKSAAYHISAAIRALEDGGAIEIASIDMQSGENALREVVGDVVHPDILDAVFDRFCVGK